MAEFHGSCHCNSVRFEFSVGEPIDKGLRCNCSICRRKGAVMSVFSLNADALNITADRDDLGAYQFGTHVAKHYFCKCCGIYTFHETRREPGNFRVNLGCVEGVDVFNLAIKVFDGKAL